MSDKPTVFFSHSSHDKAPLIALRDAFKRQTGNSIDVFLSSDGQSIRFGKNWVHEVEQALERAKLMFLFLTPRSVKSPWVLFEAGHAYGRDLQVIPVGMWGVDVGSVGGPLSLLQGFNVTSREALTNLITISNEKFDFTHSGFSDTDFAAVASPGSVSPLGKYGALVDEVSFTLDERDGGIVDRNALDVLADLAKERGLDCSKDERSCRLAGLVAGDPGTTPSSFSARLDPSALGTSLELVNEWFARIREGGLQGVPFRWMLALQVNAVVADHKISGRLSSDGVRLAKAAARYEWRGLDFKVERPYVAGRGVFSTGVSEPEWIPGAVQVTIRALGPKVSLATVAELFALLFEREILSVAG